MKFTVKILIFLFIIFLNSNVFAQDSHYDNVMKFQKSFYSVFFNTSLKSDNFIYNYTYETNYSISTGDSLEKPRRVELFGWQYFKMRPISIKTKLKKSHLSKKKMEIERAYFLFERNFDRIYKNIDTTADGEFTEQFENHLDSIIRYDMDKSLKDSSNWIFVKSTMDSKGNKKYYLNSMKNKVFVKVKIKRKDLKFMKRMKVPKQELELWAISSFFHGQYCDYDRNICYELYDK